MLKLFKVIFGIVVSTFFLYLSFKNIDLSIIKYSILNTNYLLIITSFFFFLFGYLLRVYRWTLMLRLENSKLSIYETTGPFIISIAANNILPFRFGDILRTFYFNKSLIISKKSSILSLIVERYLDLTVLMSIFLISIFIIKIKIHQYFFYLSLSLTALITFLPVIIFFLLKIFFLKKNNFKIKSIDTIKNKYKDFFFLIKSYLSFYFLLKIYIVSILAWVFEGLVYILIARAIYGVVNSFHAILALPFSNLITLIPSTPGHIGTFHFGAKSAMTMVGNDLDTSITYSVIIHFVIWLIPTIVGFAFFLNSQLKFHEFRKQFNK